MMESFQGAGVECKSGTRSHTNGPVRCGLSHDWGSAAGFLRYRRCICTELGLFGQQGWYRGIDFLSSLCRFGNWKKVFLLITAEGENIMEAMKMYPSLSLPSERGRFRWLTISTLMLAIGMLLHLVSPSVAAYAKLDDCDLCRCDSSDETGLQKMSGDLYGGSSDGGIYQ